MWVISEGQSHSSVVVGTQLYPALFIQPFHYYRSQYPTCFSHLPSLNNPTTVLLCIR